LENPDYEYYSPQRYIFLSSVLEYITLEILSLAGNVANELKRIKIIPLFIFNGLFNDDELKNLIENIFDEPLEDVIFKWI